MGQTKLPKSTGSSAEIGPNIDFFLKPLVKLKRITVFQLDQSKDRPVMLRLGYRYMPSTDGTVEHRGFAEATGRYPLLRGVLLSDRNRVEFRDISGQFFWRYRNRLSSERTFAIHGYHFTPYLRAEAFYDEKVSKWSRTALTAGSTFPIGKRLSWNGITSIRTTRPALPIGRSMVWDTCSQCTFEHGVPNQLLSYFAEIR